MPVPPSRSTALRSVNASGRSPQARRTRGERPRSVERGRARFPLAGRGSGDPFVALAGPAAPVAAAPALTEEQKQKLCSLIGLG